MEKERLESNVVPTNIYESMCVPDLGGWTGTPTPAHTPTSSVSTTNNNFIPEGKSISSTTKERNLYTITRILHLFSKKMFDILRKFIWRLCIDRLLSKQTFLRISVLTKRSQFSKNWVVKVECLPYPYFSLQQKMSIFTLLHYYYRILRNY